MGASTRLRGCARLNSETCNSITVDSVNKWTRHPASARDAVHIVQEVIGHFLRVDILAR